MKILMATMKMEIGGAETHILELAKELAAQGVDVTVVSAGGVYAKELEAAPVWKPTGWVATKAGRMVQL